MESVTRFTQLTLSRSLLSLSRTYNVALPLPQKTIEHLISLRKQRTLQALSDTAAVISCKPELLADPSMLISAQFSLCKQSV